MAPLSDEILVDTNVVIECHRTGCWKALVGNYRLVTVEKVIEECGTGRQETVDVEGVRASVVRHAVSDAERAMLQLALRGRVNLDPGEEHLLAKALVLPTAWRLCSPDNAAVRAACLLEKMDRLISLEALLLGIGHVPRPPLKDHYTEQWLQRKRTAFLLE